MHFFPFNVANSTYFQLMVDALCITSPSYKVPRMHTICSYLLNMWVDDVKKLVEDYRSIWKKTDYTLIADGFCPKGILFLKFINVSHASKTVDMLYKLFKEVVLYVGTKNIVHMVTDNAANYVVASRLLEVEFLKLFWSPYATHCINLMFRGISKVVSHASKNAKYAYNHCYAFYLKRKHIGGKEILHLAPTHFTSNFIP
uniref:DUF659 domain-containing protein n=1 Tax=Cajanus cajan TaxID=3821 RepID=A0A151RY13_CAJCA|nr:hypothetical protein KK1_031030 [Cajanus cajan]